MKIKDIILENESFDWRGETAEEIFQTDSNGKVRWGTYKKGYKGLDVEQIAGEARALKGNYPNNYRQAIRDVVDAKLEKKKSNKRTPGTSSTPRTASTPQDQRDRQDTMGRNLRHDRYYRDKPEKPSPLDYTDNVFGDPNVIDKIPGVKQTKKVAKDASVVAKTGSRAAKKAQNFDDTGKRVKKIGSRR